MAKIFVDANPKGIAYYVDGEASGYQPLPTGYTSMEAEYIAVMYGLSEFFLRWSKELDARDSNLDTELSKFMHEPIFVPVASPSQKTKRPLPDPILVLSDNEVVVKQLSRQYHIGNDRLRKLAQQIWQMTQNIEVKFQWISRKDNLAGNMLS